MRQAGFSAILLIVSFVLPLSLDASPVPVGDLKDSLLLGPHLKIFEDKAGTARWEDVLAGKHDSDFKAQNKQYRILVLPGR